MTTFAKTNFRNTETPFDILDSDRRRHMYIIGKTGMGKTTMIQNMAIQDIQNDRGVAVIDPHVINDNYFFPSTTIRIPVFSDS